MATTTNPSLTTTWTAIVAVGSNFLLTLPFSTRASIEVATTDSAVTGPTVQGHVLAGDLKEGLTRDLIGPGTVWARSQGAPATVVLNVW